MRILLGIGLISLCGCQVTNNTGMYRGYFDWRTFWQPRLIFERDRMRNPALHHEKIWNRAYFVNWDDRVYIDPRSQAQRTLPSKEGFIPGNPSSKSLPVEGTTDTPEYRPPTPSEPPTVPTYPAPAPNFRSLMPSRPEPDGPEAPKYSPSKIIPEPSPPTEDDAVASRAEKPPQDSDGEDEAEAEDFEPGEKPAKKNSPETRSAKSTTAGRTFRTRFWKRSETE